MPRPTDCTPEMIKAICAELEEIGVIETACILAGCSDGSYYNWQVRGKADRESGNDTIYVQFLDAIKKSRSVFVKNKSKELLAHSKDRLVQEGDKEKFIPGQWTALAWYLERTNPHLYGKNTLKVNLKCPTGSWGIRTMEALDEVSAATTNKFLTGELTAEQADAACRIIEARRKVIETTTLSERIAKIESKLDSV